MPRDNELRCYDEETPRPLKANTEIRPILQLAVGLSSSSSTPTCQTSAKIDQGKKKGARVKPNNEEAPEIAQGDQQGIPEELEGAVGGTVGKAVGGAVEGAVGGAAVITAEVQSGGGERDRAEPDEEQLVGRGRRRAQQNNEIFQELPAPTTPIRNRSCVTVQGTPRTPQPPPDGDALQSPHTSDHCQQHDNKQLQQHGEGLDFAGLAGAEDYSTGSTPCQFPLPHPLIVTQPRSALPAQRTDGEGMADDNPRARLRVVFSPSIANAGGRPNCHQTPPSESSFDETFQTVSESHVRIPASLHLLRTRQVTRHSSDMQFLPEFTSSPYHRGRISDVTGSEASGSEGNWDLSQGDRSHAYLVEQASLLRFMYLEKRCQIECGEVIVASTNPDQLSLANATIGNEQMEAEEELFTEEQLATHINNLNESVANKQMPNEAAMRFMLLNAEEVVRYKNLHRLERESLRELAVYEHQHVRNWGPVSSIEITVAWRLSVQAEQVLSRNSEPNVVALPSGVAAAEGTSVHLSDSVGGAQQAQSFNVEQVNRRSSAVHHQPRYSAESATDTNSNIAPGFTDRDRILACISSEHELPYSMNPRVPQPQRLNTNGGDFFHELMSRGGSRPLIPVSLPRLPVFQIDPQKEEQQSHC